MGPVVGYVPGVFDLFHIGHLNALRQARGLCDVLVAGVVSDDVCEEVKGVRPYVPLEERIAIVDAIGIVDATYAELTTDKLDAWHEVGFHVVFKGDDWRGTAKGEALERRIATVGAEVRYFPYTVHTSSSQLRRVIAAS
ncbi:adenylyltransferase/cytidyltransferase family protein [Nocardioides sp. MAH-18]|uniref:Adenylyltransferase/cytidyltransferase family protein n=1 Tax=Nocardioides agri TaxID=2682843 RepID=A0A6L6XR42_9ACTN|nr:MULTISPECIES: adenylyltransferase/cytidyltransferase family protein [unclassified Nocardioides]MBA2954266.1 adenylyltransferase/cytidyltransferase family protein [Nocardioides sp. CGMCC 1.13656]MVQ49127.1 adenylyltransferase/cytidyltransferase family protein [Nocardioides sp. MAH-18]